MFDQRGGCFDGGDGAHPFFLAISQYRTRELANDVTAAVQNERKALDLVVQTKADLFLSKGLAQGRNANLAEAALWFAEAARLTADDAEQYNANLTRYRSWLTHQPKLVAALFLQQGYREERSPGQDELVRFRPGGTQLLCQAGSEFIVWDYAQGDKWAIDEAFPGMTCAAWSGDGEWLAIGDERGRVVLIDADTRDYDTEFQLAGRVSTLAFSKQNGLLAASSQSQVRVWEIATRQFLGAELQSPTEIVHLLFNKRGSRLVAVHKSGSARIYDSGSGQHKQGRPIDLLTEVPCLIESTSEGRNAFWPTFVEDDSALIVKTDKENIGFIDPDTGQQLGGHRLNGIAYSIAIASDGTHSIICGHKSAELVKLVDHGGPDSEVNTDDSARASPPSPGLEWTSIDQHDYQDRVVTAAFGGNNLMAIGGWDKQVHLWRIPALPYNPLSLQTAPACLVRLPHQTRVRQIKISPDGSLLATVQADGLVRLWEIPEFRRNDYAVPVSSLAKLVGNGQWMTSGLSQWNSQVDQVSVYENQTGQKSGGVCRGQSPGKFPILDACCSPDGRFFVTAQAGDLRKGDELSSTNGNAGTLRMWDGANGRELHRPLALPSEARWVCWHPTVPQVAVCTEKMEVVLVNTNTFQIQATLIPRERNGRVFDPGPIVPNHKFNEQLAYSPDGNTIVAWSTNSAGLWVWDVVSQELRFPRVENDGWPVNCVEFSPDGRRIVFAGGRSGVVRVLDIDSGATMVGNAEQPGVTYTARFSPDGRRIVAACRGGQARVFDSATGQQVFEGLTHDADVVDAVYSPDSRFILTLGIDLFLRVWNANDGSLAFQPLETPVSARQVLVTPDSRFAIVGGGLDSIPVFELDKHVSHRDVDLEQQLEWAELLSIRTIDDNGTPHFIPSDGWYEKWLANSDSLPK